MRLNLIIWGVLVLMIGARTYGYSKSDTSGNADISALITKYATQYGIEREILSCVLKVESSYRMGVVSDTEDYGMSQINAKTAQLYNFNLIELLTNVDYSIRAGAIILRDYRQAFRKREIVNWVGRYNIGYQSLTSKGIGPAYQAYNSKIWACRQSGVFL